MPILTTKNPFSGENIKEYQLEDLKSVQEKLNQSILTQKTWFEKPLNQRVSLVKEALKYFESHRDLIAKDISLQMGRPFYQAKGEISGLLERANYLCEIAEDTLASDIIEDSETFYRAIEHVPLGVVFVISAWNFPLLITINSVIPSLISGNTVLLKHSSVTPEIGIHFEKAFNGLGGCQGLLQNIIIDHETTGRVIESLPINHVIFTGSTTGGKKILSHSSKKFIAPQLELGGKDGAFVNSDASMKLAVETIVDGAMFNSGQSCCGIERAYVHEDVFEEFVNNAKVLIESYVLGDPQDEATSLGPLSNPKSVDLMLSQVADAEKKGAKILAGGKDLLIGSARFMQPTLLIDVNQNMEIVKEENFGPILPVIKVKSMNEAIDQINDSSYGLTAAIFTQDVKQAEIFSSQIQAGTIFMNRCDYLDPALPWTGIKESGCGSSLSKYGFYGVTRRKALHFRKNKDV